MAGNGSKAASMELVDMTEDDRPLASWIHSGNSLSGLAGLSADTFLKQLMLL